MIAITGARLIDGTGSEPVQGVTVLVDDRQIEEVLPGTEQPSLEGMDRIDASGMTLLPGLIDCHDHLASFGYGLAER